MQPKPASQTEYSTRYVEVDPGSACEQAADIQQHGPFAAGLKGLGSRRTREMQSSVCADIAATHGIFALQV